MGTVGWEQLVITALTLTGTLGGVGLGGWINARSQREHWQREREDLAREKRRQTYAEFVLVSTECRRLLQQLLYFQQISRDAEILSTGEEYNRRNLDLHRAAAHVALTGPSTLADVAHRVIENCTAFGVALRRVEPVSDSLQARTQLPELDALRTSINEFIELAKAEVTL